MSEIPEALSSFLSDLALIENEDMRADLLIECAERFEEVPPSIATRPFSKEHLVPGCESEAYIWADANQKFYFAVENPQGVSAKALAVILDESLSGAPQKQIAAVDEEIVDQLFGRSISMGKGIGLRNMIGMLKSLTAQNQSP